MKKLLCATVAFFLFLGGISATEKTPFESTLVKIKSTIENYQKDEFHENLFKKEEEKKKFKGLEDVDKRTYILIFGIEVAATLTSLSDVWEDEFKKAGDGSDIEASKADVRKYIDELLVLRKENATKLEELATQLFKDFPDKFTKEEQEFTLKRLKDFSAKLKEK
jgi:hypothetical protein